MYTQLSKDSLKMFNISFNNIQKQSLNNSQTFNLKLQDSFLRRLNLNNQSYKQILYINSLYIDRNYLHGFLPAHDPPWQNPDLLDNLLQNHNLLFLGIIGKNI